MLSNQIIAGDDRTDEELLDDLDLTPIEGVEIRARLERMLGLSGFAVYAERDGEIDHDGDLEVETAIRLDEIIHPLPSATAPCPDCGERKDYADRCDY